MTPVHYMRGPWKEDKDFVSNSGISYFIAVTEKGSFLTAAERRLHTAHPSLSRQIASWNAGQQEKWHAFGTSAIAQSLHRNCPLSNAHAGYGYPLKETG